MNRTLTAGLVSLLLAAAPAVYAQADRDIEYRQSIFKAMAWNMAPMAAMVKGEKPYNKDEFNVYAARVAALSAMPWAAFGPGTDKGAPTKAKPEVWTEPDKVKDLAQKLQAATKNLAEVAQTGDLDKIKPAFGATGKACSTCHDSYRAK